MSMLVRFGAKAVVDFTGCTRSQAALTFCPHTGRSQSYATGGLLCCRCFQLRHPLELGGIYFFVNALRSVASWFAAAALYSQYFVAGTTEPELGLVAGETLCPAGRRRVDGSCAAWMRPARTDVACALRCSRGLIRAEQQRLIAGMHSILEMYARAPATTRTHALRLHALRTHTHTVRRLQSFLSPPLRPVIAITCPRARPLAY